MKKNLFLAMVLPMAIHAQYNGRVGINTNTPDATLQVSRKNDLPANRPQGVTFPNFSTAERSKFTGTSVGTMIFNTDKKCLEMYLGTVSGVHQWACLPDVGSAKAQSVAVSAAGFEGSYVGGVAFNGTQKTKFKLENNSFNAVSSSFADAVSIQNGSANITLNNCVWQKLTGGSPSGSQSSCKAGNLINLNSGESAMLWYTMSGTPETGTLQANFNKLGATADQSTAVGLGSASLSNKTEYVVSLTYSGTNIQGKINNASNKLVVKIPYENGSGSYNAVASAPVTTAAGQNGDVNTLSLSIPQGNFGVNGYLDATITVGGSDQEYLVKMLAPGQDYTIATIPYTLNGQSYNLVLKGIGGVPDRCFGKTTQQCVGYGANVKEHEFIYIPIQGPDGRTWLNNNLGAEYARVGSQYFNPVQQATSKTDWKAYGSLFQWQRNPDGHELMNWSNATSGTPKYNSPVSTLSDSWTNPNTNQFIASNSSNNYSWVNYTLNNASTQKTLWQSGGSTNPCPSGYHVPTHAEQQALLSAIGSGNSNLWNETGLRLPASGNRSSGNGRLYYQSSNGYFWSSEQYNSNYSWYLWFSSSNSDAGSRSNRAGGFSVRCLKDN